MKGDIRVTLYEYRQRIKPEIYDANKEQIDRIIKTREDPKKVFIITQESDLLPSWHFKTD